MSKRLSEKQKNEISDFFTNGKTIDELSKKFNCTKLTISRNLKKILGEKKYNELIIFAKSSKKSYENEESIHSISNEKKIKKNDLKENSYQSKISDNKKEEDFSYMNQLIEIAPLDYQIENVTQKDLSSVPISEVDFPKTVFMIVDKKIELETKYLKDYPDWEFLSQDELNRRTIQIFEDLKNAKRICTKDQKVIKVPNTNVFSIVAPLLVSRGISRIVTEDKLIAL
tara:strand:- start:70 stop:750 length:681 start_codon:yes stop_codon:yes gene_type:complete